MTAINNFEMPWVMEAEQAAEIILNGINKKVAVLRFPWQTSLLMRVVSWLPDWILERVMRKYNDAPPLPKNPL
jgi:short-subunit dehydrogenase